MPPYTTESGRLSNRTWYERIPTIGGMDKRSTTIYDVLAGNVKAGMVEKYGKENQTKLVGESGIGSGSISRILGTEEQPRGTSIGIEVIEKIAGALGTPSWLLLFPKAAGLLEKKHLRNFLQMCEAWSEASDNGKEIMLTAAKIARVQDGAEAERGASAVLPDAG